MDKIKRIGERTHCVRVRNIARGYDMFVKSVSMKNGAMLTAIKAKARVFNITAAHGWCDYVKTIAGADVHVEVVEV